MVATPGDFLIMKNTSDNTTAIADGTPSAEVEMTYDTEIDSNGSSISYSGGDFTLAEGKYLVMYSERWYTADETNNERVCIHGRIQIDDANIGAGASNGYIRKKYGCQRCIANGNAIIDVAEATKLEIVFWRSDSTTDNGVVRNPNWGSGITILALDTTWNYARYSQSGDVAGPIAAGWNSTGLSWDTDVEEDAGFDRTDEQITVTNAGRYLVCYTVIYQRTGTSTNDRTEHTTRLVTDADDVPAEIEGTYSECYMRIYDACYESEVTWVGVIDLSASDVIALQHNRRDGTTGVSVEAGSSIQILELPSGAECFIGQEDGTAAYDVNTGVDAETELPLSVEGYIDSDTYTFTATNTYVQVDTADNFLIFGSYGVDNGDARSIIAGRLSVEDTSLTYGSGASYCRSSTADYPAMGFGLLALSLSINDSVSIEVSCISTAGTDVCDHGSLSMISMASLFPTAPPTKKGDLYGSLRWHKPHVRRDMRGRDRLR